MYRQFQRPRHQRNNTVALSRPAGLHPPARRGVCFAMLVSALLVMLSSMAPAAFADDDDCFRLPNGTRFCAKPPPRSSPGVDAGQKKKPGREVAPDRRARRDAGKRPVTSGTDRAVRAAGGMAFLIEQFDARSIPALKPAGPCLCRDRSEPVYGFCTEGNKTYKPACAR